MTVKELIEKLKTFENQDAKVLITSGDEDNDALCTSDFTVLSDTSVDYGYVEIFINTDTCSKQL